MDFYIVGGGCYGTFYGRQLLRGADRLSFGIIHIIDHDSSCQAQRELSSPKIIFHHEDWKKFLLRWFRELLEKDSRGEEITEHYVPPTLAPHMLLEVFLELARVDFPKIEFLTKPFEQILKTPFETQLPAGTRALSFATWMCPASCIEPPTCPHTRGPKSWDMKEHLLKSGIENLHIFQCRHYAMGVGTIPVREIVSEYRRFQKTLEAPGVHQSVMATVSSCHGLVGLVETRGKHV